MSQYLKNKVLARNKDKLHKILLLYHVKVDSDWVRVRVGVRIRFRFRFRVRVTVRDRVSVRVRIRASAGLKMIIQYYSSITQKLITTRLYSTNCIGLLLLMMNMLQSLKILRNKCDSIMQTQVIICV